MAKTALLSVWRKEGIVEFARPLVKLGWDLLASGGTAEVLKNAGLPVQDVGKLIQEPTKKLLTAAFDEWKLGVHLNHPGLEKLIGDIGKPILGHRVVTLSREVHAGLLATDTPADTVQLEEMGLPRIDLACVDLYPLLEEISKPDCTVDSVIEKTDVGGPTMLLAAAKGGRIVICDPVDRMSVLKELQEKGDVSTERRQELRAKAQFTVVRYYLASARFHSKGEYDGFVGRRASTCLYGENAWQNPAAHFAVDNHDPLALHYFLSEPGIKPSYNNLCDLNRLLQTMTHIAAGFTLNYWKMPKIALAAKHGNACGAGIDDTNPKVALEKMIMGDTEAVFGGWVMTNFAITEPEAHILHEFAMPSGSHRLLDGVVAPQFNDRAIRVLERKNGKCRIMGNPALLYLDLDHELLDRAPVLRSVRGGFLQQPGYWFVLNLSDPLLQKSWVAGSKTEEDLITAWAIGSTSNSNTITLVRNGQLIANAVGQHSRVRACKLALQIASETGNGCVGAAAYSDSFFPFPDGPEILADAGITTVFATRGSVQDKVVAEVFERKQVAFYTLPDTYARGFFAHG